MDEVTSGASRGSRLLSRTLLILGGAAATTAAAWLISSASANAATLADPGLTSPNAVTDTAAAAGPADSIGGIVPALVTTPAGAATSAPAAAPAITHGPASTATTEATTAATSEATSVAAVTAGQAGRVVGVVSSPVNSAVRSASGLAAVTGRLRAAVDQVGGSLPVSVPALPGPAHPVAPVYPAHGSAGQHPHLGHLLVAGPRVAHPLGQAPVVMSMARPAAAPGARPVSAGELPGPPDTPLGQPCPTAIAPAGAGGSGANGPTGPGGTAAGLPGERRAAPGLSSVGASARRVAPPVGAARRQPGVTPD